jgi:hypothetical protein
MKDDDHCVLCGVSLDSPCLDMDDSSFRPLSEPLDWKAEGGYGTRFSLLFSEQFPGLLKYPI